jgi:hypothetical protein
MQFMYIVHLSSVFADRISMSYTCSVFILAGIFLSVLTGQGTGIVYTFENIRVASFFKKPAFLMTQTFVQYASKI